LKPGRNSLEVRVVNLWVNRLIADAGLPVEKRLTWTTDNPCHPNDPLLPSGLLGPVVLRTTGAMVSESCPRLSPEKWAFLIEPGAVIGLCPDAGISGATAQTDARPEPQP
jgi:hypothetical protein